ncbi:DNA endonuclease VII [Escherichia phage UB]|uniref:DNA endonuclease VII n=1 Tax=Escherichia phage UB TaxID=2268588 RepID=A0A2Z5H9Y3_9CAUD|nr:DNA endonuclease VII [Escherichia phage UB]
MKKRLKDSKDAANYRNELLKKQNGIDPIIKEPITKPVLDHYHYGNQHCRQVLQNEVNAWEGKVQNSFNRYMKHLTDKPLYEVLRNLADYLERNNSIPDDEQVIHHTALTVDVNKFKRLPATQQTAILEGLGVVPGSNTTARVKQARKLIKDGKLNMVDIKKGS